MERIEMSGEEVKRLEVLRQLADGVMTQRMAAERLALTVRQVRRLLRRYEAAGAAGGHRTGVCRPKSRKRCSCAYGNAMRTLGRPWRPSICAPRGDVIERDSAQLDDAGGIVAGRPWATAESASTAATAAPLW